MSYRELAHSLIDQIPESKMYQHFKGSAEEFFSMLDEEECPGFFFRICFNLLANHLAHGYRTPHTWIR